jgi:hypothetical protein
MGGVSASLKQILLNFLDIHSEATEGTDEERMQ